MKSEVEILEKLKKEKKPAIDKLISNLKKYGIDFIEQDGVLDNVVFTKDDKIYKISHILFYRMNGRCIIQKTNPKTNLDEVVKFEDKDFYEWLMVYILIGLNIEKI